MAVGPNPDSNPGLSDRRRQANDIRDRTRSRRGIEPRCTNREVENFSDELEPGSNPGRANRRLFDPFKNSQADLQWIKLETCTQVAPLHQPHLWGQITALTHTHTHKLGIPRCISGKGGSQDLRAGVPMPGVGDTDDIKKKFRNFGKE